MDYDDRKLIQELLQEMRSLKQIVGSLRDEVNVLKQAVNSLESNVRKSDFQYVPMVK